MKRPLRASARAGFSLIEAAVTAALLIVLMSSAILAANRGIGAFRTTQGAADVEARLRRALDRSAFELLSVGEEVLLPNPVGNFGTSDLEFQRTTGLNGLNPTWGIVCRLAWEQETGELDDGLDNDGDGLVDEGQLVFTRDVGGNEQRSILARGVAELLEGETANGGDDNANGVIDERGFNIHRVNGVLFVRLSLEEAGEQGTIVRTLETSVRLRN